MKVVIACEYSGAVRDNFLKLGHDAISVDLLDTEVSGPHYKGDIFEYLDNAGYPDMLIGFPPCTNLCVSGARWFKNKQKEQAESVEFFMRLVNLPIDKIAIENPIGIMSTKFRKPNQIIQPWQFGHPEVKSTCLWLKNLPCLTPTNIVDGREPRVHRMGPSPNRWKERSRTYSGIAQAMAEQWGN